MSSRPRGISDSQKKALAIIIPVVIIVIAVIVSSVLYFVKGTDKGQEIQAKSTAPI